MFLAESAWACDRLPPGAGAEYVGKVCPNNPYENNRDLYAEVAEDFGLLDLAHYVEGLTAVGALPSIDKLLPEEYFMARWMTQYRKNEEARARAESGE